MAHKHSVIDNDNRFTINAETKQITNQSGKTTLAQYDHNSEIFTFELPRVVEGHDMTLCDEAQIHYINTDNTTRETSKGLYKVSDFTALSNDGTKIEFTWLVSSNATKYSGKLTFRITFICRDDDNNITYRWSTAEHTSVVIISGMNNGEEIAEEYPDILEQWRQEVLETVEAEVTGTVKSINDVTPDENGNVDIDALPDSMEQIAMLIEADMLPAVHDASGAIITDENGNIILRY